MSDVDGEVMLLNFHSLSPIQSHIGPYAKLQPGFSGNYIYKLASKAGKGKDKEKGNNSNKSLLWYSGYVETFMTFWLLINARELGIFTPFRARGLTYFIFIGNI